MRSRGAARVVAVALALLLLGTLGACSAIPLTGPVGTLQPRATPQDDEASPIDAIGPSDGDAPADIVSGFLAAGADSANDYAVARSYLTPTLAQDWDATTGTSVIDQGADVAAAVGETKLRATLHVVRRVDPQGERVDLDEPVTVRQSFGVQRVDGEWRISQAPDGIVVEESKFSQIFTPVTLYFYADTSWSTAVPDVRWFARRKGRPTTVVSALLAGPSSYLQGVVSSAFPSGAKLQRGSVPVDQGTATVDLPEAVVSGLSDQDRQRMVQQLTLSLRDVGTVSSVRLSMDGTDLDVGSQGSTLPEPALSSQVDETMVGVRDGVVVSGPADALAPVKGAKGLGASPRSPALAPSGDAVVALSADGSELRAASGGNTAVTLLRGTGLLAPSFDPRSWVWTGRSVQGAPLQAVRAGGGDTVSLDEPWLRGLTLTSVRASLDGTRLAITAREGQRELLLVTGIRRDEDGKPLGLTTPLRLRNAAGATRVLWAAGDTLVMYRVSVKDLLSIDEVGLDGRSTAWRQKLRGINQLAVATGADKPVYAQTADGLYTRTGTAWQRSDLDAAWLSYRG